MGVTKVFSGELGELLRSAFALPVDDPLPAAFLELLSRLDGPSSVDDAAFKRQLTAVVPYLRAYGRSLSGNRDAADDLVQDTLLRAWAARDRYQPGTNMRAWATTILRNHFLGQSRRNRFRGEWNPELAERLLSAPAGQDRIVELSDLQRALDELPTFQREALLLVGAGGFSYEEAAEIAGIALGTIKSRVARGRTALEQLITEGQLPSRRKAKGDGRSAFDTILDAVDDIAAA